MTVDDFAHRVGHRAHGVLHAPAHAPIAVADPGDHADHARHHQQQRQREIRAVVEHGGDHAEREQAVLQHRLERRGGGLGDLVGGVGDARDLLTGSLLREMRHRQAQIAGEGILADVAHHAAAEDAHAVVGGEGSHAAHRRDNEDQNRQPEDRLRVLGDEQAVDHRLDHLHEQGDADRIEDQPDDGARADPAIRHQITEQAPVDAPGLCPVDFPFRRAHGRSALRSGVVAMDRCVKPS